MGMLDALMNYTEQGARLSAGFWPMSAADIAKQGFDPAGAGARYEQWGPHAFETSTKGGVTSRMKMPAFKGTMENMGRLGGYGMPVLGLAASAYLVGSGYQEAGMSGAIAAGYTDVAIMSAMNSAMVPKTPRAIGLTGRLMGAFHTSISGRLPTIGAGLSMMGTGLRGAGMLGVGLGAVMGSSAGSGLGMPGTFAGAYLGAHAMRRPGLAVLGFVGAKVASSAVKSGFNYIKAGYRKERMKRRIDTAGSTASFMTENAFSQRQRAVSAMQNSHLNARSALGSEASYMHMPRDYFSNYRRM